jgi:hypothetical protein
MARYLYDGLVCARAMVLEPISFGMGVLGSITAEKHA